MRLAIFSDVHANPAALRAFLQDLHTRQVDACWSLGDMFGRGWNPNETAFLLRRLYAQQPEQHRSAWLLGNHDLMVLGHISTASFGPVGGAGGHDPTAERIAAQHREWLEKNSPDNYRWARETVGEGRRKTHRVCGHGVYLAHAAYVYEESGQVNEVASYSSYINHHRADAPRNIARHLGNLRKHAPEARLMIAGHSHVKGLWAWHPEAELAERCPDYGQFELGRQTIFYLNPGSLGFPRDEACPSYALLEVGEGWHSIQVEFVTLHYDASAIPEDAFPLDYPSELKQALRRCSPKEGQP